MIAGGEGVFNLPAVFVVLACSGAGQEDAVAQEAGVASAATIEGALGDTAEELDAAFASLSADGRVYMPINNYGFSKRFGWCADRFGVSWQLNLE